ncbi:phenylalanine--tRNA ligase subunit alpha [Telmatocola sphagniphila]|uniref:Phenylalanine--tRNA ligase alpha subunit n=1 Tax=Telmatocola sphagniphila TaxID=1123043 RepID=A0A8E6BAX7_9BACT|nr:phenylalanine--tRNA ligase subunit alpha [Telmatocola sphagniphila]QVL34509.1 phenylalanine--tRNA ligase subunit alpha [Telmatocola sphagniphila]
MSIEALKLLETKATEELAVCSDENSLKAWNTKYFGDRGEIPAALKLVGTLPPAERKGYGQEANRVKVALSTAYESAFGKAKEAALLASLNENPLDITLPGRSPAKGGLHVATRVMREIYSIFSDMGFQIFRSREVEDDQTNFELLNMPAHHPARDMWDTFHTKTPGVLLRTHTSPGQIHVMKEFCPQPIRAVLPGFCYRYEAITPRSEIQFEQVEGLVVGPNVTMTDLKGTITTFARRLFGEERQIRIRSSYFPFTEPSIEVDIDWPKEDPNADRLTKGTGWLEIMGAGMIHPTVLRNGGYDPDQVSGFAFGLGPQRITMLKYGIDDIRQFWANDLRFLEQF